MKNNSKPPYKYSTVFVLETNNLDDIVDCSGLVGDLVADRNCQYSVFGHYPFTKQEFKQLKKQNEEAMKKLLAMVGKE